MIQKTWNLAILSVSQTLANSFVSQKFIDVAYNFLSRVQLFIDI